MAERRMFAMKIIDSDAFLDMPTSTQALYFHLSMRADDDGFISNAKRIMRMIGSSDDDLRILLAKRFLLSFDSGIVVIKHWRLHNYIAKDRYTETIYKEEKEKLFTKENGSYTDCIQNVDTGKVRLVKLSIDKDSIDNIPDKPDIQSKPKKDKKAFTAPTQEEVISYVIEKQLVINPYDFYSYYSKLDWCDNHGNKVKSWKGKAVTWDSREMKDHPEKKPYILPSKPLNPEKKLQCPRCQSEVIAGLCTKCRIPVDSDGKELK